MKGWKGKDSLNGALEIQNARLMVRTLTACCLQFAECVGISCLMYHQGGYLGVGLGSFHMGGEENAQRLKS